MFSDDAAYKQLFSVPEMVRDLLRACVPDPWVQSLDFATLEKVAPEFITHKRGLRRISDLIWRVQAEGGLAGLYVLMEFQTQVQFHMPVRIMQYVSLLHQDLMAGQPTPHHGLLPPILPLVIYNGERPWQAPTDMAELVRPMPSSLSAFDPRLRFWLIDESQRPQLRSDDNLFVAMMDVVHAQDAEKFENAFDHMQELLQNNQKCSEVVMNWLGWMLSKRGTVLAQAWVHMIERKGQMGYYKWGIQKWFDHQMQQGLERGIEQGIGQGQGLLLQKQLSKRFGALPHALLQKINEGTAPQIEVWGERVLYAATLEEVFAEPRAAAH